MRAPTPSADKKGSHFLSREGKEEESVVRIDRSTKEHTQNKEIVAVGAPLKESREAQSIDLIDCFEHCGGCVA